MGDFFNFSEFWHTWHRDSNKYDFKLGLAVYELGYMPILVNLANFTLQKVNWQVFCHPADSSQFFSV